MMIDLSLPIARANPTLRVEKVPKNYALLKLLTRSGPTSSVIRKLQYQYQSTELNFNHRISRCSTFYSRIGHDNDDFCLKLKQVLDK